MILKIDCPDTRGLVYKVTQVIYSHELNVVRNDEYVDEEHQHFFMRTKFSGEYNRDKLKNELQQVLPDNCNIEIYNSSISKLLIFASKEHQCLADILIRCMYNELNAEVLAVISNHNQLEPLVSKFDLPYHFISHEGKSREEHEKEVSQVVSKYDPDYLVLAKYMRILNPAFVLQFENRLINIHHSFLPAFKGASPYKQAFDRGVKIIGATAHFVNNELDEGPIIAQDTTMVNHRFTSKSMSSAGKDVEKIVLAKALKLVIDHRVFVHKNKTIIF